MVDKMRYDVGEIAAFSGAWMDPRSAPAQLHSCIRNRKERKGEEKKSAAAARVCHVL